VNPDNVRVVLYDISGGKVESLTAKIGWSSLSLEPPAKLKIGEKEVKKLMKLSVKLRLGSVLDFPHYIFAFEGVSRAFTHQLVRHRVAAYVQQSLRRVKVNPELDPRDPWFVIPPSLVLEGADVVLRYVESQLAAGRTYLYLLGSGVPPEDARYALPIGIKTFIACIMNAEELLHVVKVRSCASAQWEIRSAVLALLTGLNLVYPSIFSYAGPHCVYDGVCRGGGGQRCCSNVKELLGKLRSLAEEWRGAYEREGRVDLDLTDLLGFRAPEDLEEEVGRKLGLRAPLNLSYEVKLSVERV